MISNTSNLLDTPNTRNCSKIPLNFQKPQTESMNYKQSNHLNFLDQPKDTPNSSFPKINKLMSSKDYTCPPQGLEG